MEKYFIVFMILFSSCSPDSDQNEGYIKDQTLLKFKNFSVSVYKRLQTPKNKYFGDYFIYKISIFKNKKKIFQTTLINQYKFQLKSFSESQNIIDIQISTNPNPNDFGQPNIMSYVIRINLTDDIPRIVFFYPVDLGAQDKAGLKLVTFNEEKNKISLEYNYSIKVGVPKLGYGHIKVVYSKVNNEYKLTSYSDEIFNTDYVKNLENDQNIENVKYFKETYGLEKINNIFSETEFLKAFY